MRVVAAFSAILCVYLVCWDLPKYTMDPQFFAWLLPDRVGIRNAGSARSCPPDGRRVLILSRC